MKQVQAVSGFKKKVLCATMAAVLGGSAGYSSYALSAYQSGFISGFKNSDEFVRRYDQANAYAKNNKGVLGVESFKRLVRNNISKYREVLQQVIQKGVDKLNRDQSGKLVGDKGEKGRLLNELIRLNGEIKEADKKLDNYAQGIKDKVIEARRSDKEGNEIYKKIDFKGDVLGVLAKSSDEILEAVYDLLMDEKQKNGHPLLSRLSEGNKDYVGVVTHYMDLIEKQKYTFLDTLFKPVLARARTRGFVAGDTITLSDIKERTQKEYSKANVVTVNLQATGDNLDKEVGKNLVSAEKNPYSVILLGFTGDFDALSRLAAHEVTASEGSSPIANTLALSVDKTKKEIGFSGAFLAFSGEATNNLNSPLGSIKCNTIKGIKAEPIMGRGHLLIDKGAQLAVRTVGSKKHPVTSIEVSAGSVLRASSVYVRSSLLLAGKASGVNDQQPIDIEFVSLDNGDFDYVDKEGYLLKKDGDKYYRVNINGKFINDKGDVLSQEASAAQKVEKSPERVARSVVIPQGKAEHRIAFVDPFLKHRLVTFAPLIVHQDTASRYDNNGRFLEIEADGDIGFITQLNESVSDKGLYKAHKVNLNIKSFKALLGTGDDARDAFVEVNLLPMVAGEGNKKSMAEKGFDSEIRLKSDLAYILINGNSPQPNQAGTGSLVVLSGSDSHVKGYVHGFKELRIQDGAFFQGDIQAQTEDESANTSSVVRVFNGTYGGGKLDSRTVVAHKEQLTIQPTPWDEGGKLDVTSIAGENGVQDAKQAQSAVLTKELDISSGGLLVLSHPEREVELFGDETRSASQSTSGSGTNTSGGGDNTAGNTTGNTAGNTAGNTSGNGSDSTASGEDEKKQPAADTQTPAPTRTIALKPVLEIDATKGGCLKLGSGSIEVKILDEKRPFIVVKGKVDKAFDDPAKLKASVSTRVAIDKDLLAAAHKQKDKGVQLGKEDARLMSMVKDENREQGLTFILAEAETGQWPDTMPTDTVSRTLLFDTSFNVSEDKKQLRGQIKPAADIRNNLMDKSVSAPGASALAAHLRHVGKSLKNDRISYKDALVLDAVQRAEDEQRLDKLADEVLPHNVASGANVMVNRSLMNRVHGSIDQHLNGLKDMVASGDTFESVGFWGQYIHNNGSLANKKSGKGGIYGFSSKLDGITLGMEGEFDEQLAVGAAFSFAKSNISTRKVSQSTKGNHYLGSLYMSWTEGLGFVDGVFSLGMGKNDYKSTVDGFNYKGDGKTVTWGLGVGGGYNLPVHDEWTLQPRAELSYSSFKVNDYKMKNGNEAAFEQQISTDTVHAVELGVGFRLLGDIPLEQGTLKPEYRMMGYYDFCGKNYGAELKSLDPVTGISDSDAKAEKLKGMRREKGRALVGLGLAFDMDNNLSLGMNYDYNFSGKFRDHSVMAKASYSF